MPTAIHNRFNMLARIYAMLGCAWFFGRCCIVVTIRTLFGKLKRDTASQYFKTGSEKLLRKVKANYKISYVDQFHYLDDLPRIYMSNHLSLFDTPLFYATIPDTIRIVTKKELTKIPLIGNAILSTEHAIVDRHTPGQNKDFYVDAKKKLTNGIALWFFPEGTRSRAGVLLPFRMGGFRLANEVGAQIIPVGIKGTHEILAADNVLPHLNQTIEICIGQPIDARAYDTPDKQKELLGLVEKTVKELIS